MHGPPELIAESRESEIYVDGVYAERSIEEDAGAERQRSSHHHQFTAPGARARPPAPAGLAATAAAGDQVAVLQRLDRRAEAPLRGELGARLQLRPERPGALPRQPVQPARRFGRRLPRDPVRDQELQPAGAAA